MKRFYLMLLLLVTVTMASAAKRNGHFFMSLKDQNVTIENIEQRFSQWFSLPDETEWSMVSQRTNRLGMTRVEYRQYVGGVEVEHSQVLLHVKDGRVMSANGTVMETRRMPAALRLYRRNAPAEGTPADKLGRKIYLVDTRDGYRYATKELSADQLYWIYTDMESGQQLKRVPIRHHLTEDATKVTGKSFYSGDVEMDATFDPESSKYVLYDPVRNIHTRIGSALPSLEKLIEDGTFSETFPSITLPVPEEEMTEEMWKEWGKNFDPESADLTKYIMDNTELVASSSPSFSAYKITNITFEKITYYGYEVIPTEENEMLYSLEIYYDEGSKGLIHRSYGTASELPLTFDPQERKCYYELPAEGATIMLWNEHSLTRYEGWGRGDDDRELLASLHVVPDGSLIKTFDADGIKATIKYEPSSWIAADIHWGMERTYDFYKEVFDRNSYDDQGAPIINLFYLPNEFEKDSYFFTSIAGNAFALDVTPHPMVFCPGDDALMSEVVELSVMAHEFTHLITSCTAGLVNEGESGALNESFSDIMGINVKKYFLGNDASWKIGEGVNLEGDNVRDMAFPENSGDGDYDSCPDTYCGEFWFPTGLVPDGGGVHTNCGVQNKWYYLLTDGDSGTNDNDYTYDVTGIGIEKSRQIAYLTLTEYATEEAEYPDIRLCSHQAAQMLFGEDSVEANTVLEAWDAVGVTEDCDDDDWLSIETVSPEPTVRHNYYDLQGRRVMQPESGFYVKDGHKIIVK